MEFSVFFWNIWFYNQIEGRSRSDSLLNELKRLVNIHKPDIIALNEVVQSSNDGSILVLKYLQKLGYTYTHHASMVKFSDNWLSGAALCSRLKISRPHKLVISNHGFAAKRGYPGYNKEAIGIHAVLAGGSELNILVAHPLATIDAPRDHVVAMKNLNRLVRRKPYNKNTILVGDMNEWRFFPGAFRSKVTDVMYSRTGTVLRPTWRYNANRFTPIRANLDYLYWSKQSDFSLKDFKVLPSNVSDHRPLLATFEYA